MSFTFQIKMSKYCKNNSYVPTILVTYSNLVYFQQSQNKKFKTKINMLICYLVVKNQSRYLPKSLSHTIASFDRRRFIFINLFTSNYVRYLSEWYILKLLLLGTYTENEKFVI